MKKINLSFFILLILFIQVIFTDTLIYFFKLNYIIANIIAFVLNIMLIILLFKKKKIQIKNDFNRWDLIFLTLVLAITITTIIFPDEFWDSYSYHIYLQQEPFSDKVNDDFFPGRTLTSFVSPIADRIFYMFRAVLGFRLGTLPGYLLLVVMFYQIKKILNKLLEQKLENKYLSILSILPLGTFIILQQIGTYYIDNFPIAILLEYIYIVLYESENIFKEKTKLYYLALLVGIGISIKITTAIYMAIPLLYILIKNIKHIKQIKWYDYILLIITAFLPMLPYFIDAIIQTGSPVFPYYNTIFKSKYFLEKNWLDDRYGPKNILEFLIWPIYIIKYPNRAYEVGKTDFSFASGYIIAILYLSGFLVYKLYRKIIKKEDIKLNSIVIFIIFLLYFYIAWEKFVIGYTRYAGIIAVMSTILLITLFVKALQNKKMILIIFCAFILINTFVDGVYQYIHYGSPYNYIRILQGDNEIKDIIKINMKKVFKDRGNEKYDINGIWGVIYDDSAIPVKLNVDDKLVHLEYGTKTGETQIAKDLYWENVLNNDIYIPLYSFKLYGKLEFLDIFKFKIVEITDVIKNVEFLQNDDKIYIIKVKYDESVIAGENKQIFEQLIKELN